MQRAQDRGEELKREFSLEARYWYNPSANSRNFLIPGSITVMITVIGALRSFDLISVMTGGGPFESSTVLAYYMYDQAIKYYRLGYSAAIAVVLFAIMLLYIIYHLRRLLRNER